MSGLTRSLAPWHPAVAWALGCSALVVVLAGISHGLSSGIHGGIAVLLGWAVARELAPAGAFVGIVAPFATLPFVIPGDADLRACFGVLLAARIVAATTGRAPTMLDCVLIVPFCWWCSIHPAGLPAAVVLAAALFAAGGSLRHRVAGVGALGASLLSGSLEGTITVRGLVGDPNRAEQVLMVLLCIAIVTVLARSAPDRLAQRDDRRKARMSGARIRAARLVAAASLVAGVTWIGLAAPFHLAAASGGVIAAASGLGSYGRPARTPGSDDDRVRSRT